MHNMPPIERCVAYTFESYSGGLLSHFEKKEHKTRLKFGAEEGTTATNHIHEEDEDTNNDVHKTFTLSPEKLVEAALKTMDSSSLSSLSENVTGIKQEDNHLQQLDSASENSVADSQGQDIPTPASPELHDAQAMDVETSVQHSESLLPPCSPRAASPVSKCPSMETFSRQASAIQRQAGLLALGLSTARSLIDGRECKLANRTRALDPLQQLEHTLELNRRDLVSSNQYSNLALCLARQRADLMNSSMVEVETKPCNHSDSSGNGATNGIEVDSPTSHILNMTGQSEENGMGMQHRIDGNLTLVQKHNQTVNCNDDQEMELHHASEQNLDLTRQSDHGIELSRHSEQNLVNCHSEQNLELHRSSESGLGMVHPTEANLDMMHHHHHHHGHHHSLELNSSPHPSDLTLIRHAENDMRRHLDHNLNLVHHGEQGDVELVHHAVRRNLHIDLNQHNERGAIIGMRSRTDHNLAIVVGRNLEMDPNDHHLDLSPHPPQMSSPLRRDHLLELAVHDGSPELVHSLSRSSHLDGGRLHSDLRSPLSLPEHHGYGLMQHRPDLQSPASRHQDQSLDMSCHASNMNSPTPSRCSDLNSPLPHQDPNLDANRQTDTPAELSRPPSHSIDLTTGRPTSLPVELNRPASHNGRQMPVELLPLETGRMVSPGYQPYSPPVYQPAPPAHMPAPSPSLHSNYHSYSGFY